MVAPKFYIVGILSCVLLTACEERTTSVSKEVVSSFDQVSKDESIATLEHENLLAGAPDQAEEKFSFQVYKSPTCGCCKLWVQHAETSGFTTEVIPTKDLMSLKAKLGIAPEFRSCHTAVSNQGYVFEGHVPAKIIKKFLQEKPENALGLAAPGMPKGSPGMEFNDEFDPYDIVLLKKDGSSELYARIESKEEQF